MLSAFLLFALHGSNPRVPVFALHGDSHFAQCLNFCVSVDLGHMRVLLLCLLLGEICCGLSNVSSRVLALQSTNLNARSALVRFR